MNKQPPKWLNDAFRWSCSVLDNFWLSNRGKIYKSRLERYEYNVNLCQYVRMILIWGPLAFLVSISIYSYAFFVIFILPFIVFSTGSIIYEFQIIGIVISSIAITVAFLIMLFNLFFKFGNLIYGSIKNYTKHQEKKTDTISFFTILGQYTIAVHDKICPILTIKQRPVFQTKVKEDE